jgi:hypothetical protein
MFPNDFKVIHRVRQRLRTPYRDDDHELTKYLYRSTIPLKHQSVLNESVKKPFWIIIGILSAKLKTSKESLKAKTCFCKK